LDKIYAYSKGVPRVINSFCDRCLLTGFIKDKQEINAAIVKEVAKELGIKKIATRNEEVVVNC
tara:strand:- start:666 stop:854 length:189 start_codon:yes stop_codon:yes gene_type:complete